MLSWANSFSICCILDSHDYQATNHKYDCLVAVGNTNLFFQDNNKLNSLREYCIANNKWLFGHVNFDLKSETENVISKKADRIGFSDISFFVPEILLILNENSIKIFSSLSIASKKIFEAINNFSRSKIEQITSRPSIKNLYSKEKYIEIVNKLKEHILRGDCYEINFCMEFFAENIYLTPEDTYKKLTKISPTPFSCFYKQNEKYLLCASPERYISKTGTKIISQPMKGTIARALNDSAKDDNLKKELQNSKKDRSENVMIVDLVRNDLARICKSGSITIDEIFGIQSFNKVHQMVSTISGTVDVDINFADVLKATFPMGSMTGAPKKRVLQLIDENEETGRGIFSGTVGYINPDNDFDFNVIIRSIMYNATTQTVSFMAGSGITFYSDPEQEYKECMLKAKGMFDAIYE